MIDIQEFLELKDKVKQLERDNKGLKERIEKLEVRIPPRGPIILNIIGGGTWNATVKKREISQL